MMDKIGGIYISSAYYMETWMNPWVFDSVDTVQTTWSYRTSEQNALYLGTFIGYNSFDLNAESSLRWSSMASGGGSGHFTHDVDTSVSFTGGKSAGTPSEPLSVFKTLATGSGSIATVANVANGTISFTGGSGLWCPSILNAADVGATAIFSNTGTGAMIFTGGTSARSSAIDNASGGQF